MAERSGRNHHEEAPGCGATGRSGEHCPGQPAIRLPRTKGDAGRLLTGRVIDRQDAPLPSAVVYLANTRTRAVKTFIVGQDGNYRFPGAFAQRGL